MPNQRQTSTTPNRGYNVPAQGTEPWDQLVNDNWGAIDQDVQALFDQLGITGTFQPLAADTFVPSAEGWNIGSPQFSFTVPEDGMWFLYATGEWDTADVTDISACATTIGVNGTRVMVESTPLVPVVNGLGFQSNTAIHPWIPLNAGDLVEVLFSQRSTFTLRLTSNPFNTAFGAVKLAPP